MFEKDIQELEDYYKKYRKSEHLFPYISQREDWDCGVACYAMVADLPYNKARKIWPKRPQRGISGWSLARLTNARELKRHGYLLPLKNYLNDGGNYILLTKSGPKDWGHYVIKDANNNIYDPEDGIVDISEYAKKFVSFHIKLNK